MLLEAFAPNPDTSEFHQIQIAAPPEDVYRALWTVDLGRSPLVRGLLALRSLPKVIRTGRKDLSAQRITLQTLIDAGFGRLAEEPDHEIVLGVSGRFWRLVGNLEPFSRAAFSAPVPAGMAQAVWNFRVVPAGDRKTILSTETRVTCGDSASRTKFRVYWLVIRPFSGLIRTIMLKAVQRAAESRAVS
jgi:hypothetical protein